MRRLLLSLVIGLLLASAFTSPLVQSAETVSANVAGLQDQLTSGLKVRTKSERDFITKVVTMVGNDTLPMELVKSTFQWTRKNPAAKRYPFVYFQRALRERAKKLGIVV